MALILNAAVVTAAVTVVGDLGLKGMVTLLGLGVLIMGLSVITVGVLAIWLESVVVMSW